LKKSSLDNAEFNERVGVSSDAYVEAASGELVLESSF